MYKSIQSACDTAVCDYCLKQAPAINTRKLGEAGWDWKTTASFDTTHICPTCQQDRQKAAQFAAIKQ